MKRYAFIILAALTMFVGIASTANAQVFSSRSSVYAGPGVYQSNRQSVFVGGNGGSVYVGSGRGGFDLNIGTPGFSLHIGDGYYRGYGGYRNRGPVYRGPIYRNPNRGYDYDYGYHRYDRDYYRPGPPTAVVYDRFGYPVRVQLYWDGYGYYYYLDGYRYRY